MTIYGIKRFYDHCGDGYTSSVETKLYTNKTKAQERMEVITKQIKDYEQKREKCEACNYYYDFEDCETKADVDELINTYKARCPYCDFDIDFGTDFDGIGCENSVAYRGDDEGTPEIVEFELED